MKTKCPYCESGCEKCTDGYLEFSFASGTLYTRHCNSCKEDNGGLITDKLPKRTPGACVFCNSDDTSWVKIGDTEELDLTEL